MQAFATEIAVFLHNGILFHKCLVVTRMMHIASRKKTQGLFKGRENANTDAQMKFV